MLAVLRMLGEEFVGLGWLFARKEKRRCGRRCGGFYRRVFLRRGLGFCSESRSDGGGASGVQEEESGGRRSPWQVGQGCQREEGAARISFRVRPKLVRGRI
jgi:hypothetical protein